MRRVEPVLLVGRNLRERRADLLDPSREQPVAQQAEHEQPEHRGEREHLSQTRAGSHRDRAEHGLGQQQGADRLPQFGAEAVGKRLRAPLGLEQHAQHIRQREQARTQQDQGGGEVPAIEVVRPGGSADRQQQGQGAEGQHRLVPRRADRGEGAVQFDQHEDHAQPQRDRRDRQHHAAVLADHEHGPGHGLADHGQHRPVLDLAVHHPRGQEGREDRPAGEDGRQADVDEHPLVVLHGEGREGIRQHDEQGADHDHHQRDGLADAFQEGVSRDREELLEPGHGGLRSKG